MSDLPKLSQMHAEAEKNLLDFLQADLARCATFADLALTELRIEDRQAAQNALTNAEKGYATILRFVPNVKDGHDRLDIERQLSDLRTRLDSLPS
jgi:hypothetical protein